jgi:hypothetical protein
MSARPVATDLRAAVRMASLAVASIADGLLAAGAGSARDLARRAALAGGRAAFLEQRGLAPATAARLAVKGVFPEVPESEWSGELEADELEADELEEEFRRRGMTVTLTWSDKVMTQKDIKANRSRFRGGIYIQVDPADHRKLLKVGKAIDFLDRPKDYGAGACFWLASLSIGSIDPVGMIEGAEHAVARTLMRMGHDLPRHDVPRAALATGPGSRTKIHVRNVLPSTLVGGLAGAYTKPAATSHGGRPDEAGRAATAPSEAGALIITPTMSWESGD